MKGSFTWKQVPEMREVLSCYTIGSHPNIVRIYEVHRTSDAALHYVFEYMPFGSLHDLFRARVAQDQGPLPHSQIKIVLQDVLQALEYLHFQGWMHRDVKPENILSDGRNWKLADFSLAREFGTSEPVTTYISTRWYRAPEILLGSPDYSSAVDVFALGCIGAEMFRLRPLFPGHDEMDQLQRTLTMLGSPTSVGWNEGVHLMDNLGIKVPQVEANKTTKSNLEEWMSSHDREPHSLLDLLVGMLMLHPSKRFTATEALNHRYLHSSGRVFGNADVFDDQHSSEWQEQQYLPYLTLLPGESIESIDKVMPTVVPSLAGDTSSNSTWSHNDHSHGIDSGSSSLQEGSHTRRYRY